MIEELLQLDTRFFVYLNSLGSEPWDGLWRALTYKWTWIPLYLVLLFLVFKEYGLKGTLLIAVCIALMLTFTDQLSNVFKDGFQRLRPCQLEELKDKIRFVAVRCGKYGYFSAHSASSMAAAVFLGLLLRHRYRYLPFLLLLYTAITGYSRIYLGVHFPLDVVSGMAIGGLAGWGFYLLQKWVQKKFDLQPNK